MPHQEQDLEVTAKDTREYRVIAKDSNGQPINLSTFQAIFVVKVQQIDTLAQAKIVKKTAGLTGGSTDQLAIVNALKGIMEIKLSSADTALVEGVYRYAVVLKSLVSGKRHTIARGAFHVLLAEIEEELT